MAAGTFAPTRLLDRIGVVAAAITALTDRVYQGKKRFSEAENLEENIRALTAETQGYFGFWMGPRREGKVTERGTVTVLGLLVLNLPKDSTSDCNSAYEVAETLLRALKLQSNFSSQGAAFKEGSYQIVDDSLEDGIAEFDFEVTYEIGSCS
jgi:hypothetical protein